MLATGLINLEESSSQEISYVSKGDTSKCETFALILHTNMEILATQCENTSSYLGCTRYFLKTCLHAQSVFMIYRVFVTLPFELAHAH